MLSFFIEPEEIKNFMYKLLKTNTFDNLEVRQILLETLVRYEIDCVINKDYLENSRNLNNLDNLNNKENKNITNSAENSTSKNVEDFENKEEKNKKDRTFVKWSEIKPYILELIKGKKKPKVLKIIFSLSDKDLEKVHINAKALFLNLSYENEQVIGTTGTSQKNFSLEKTLDLAWENFILSFFEENNIKIKQRIISDN